MMRGGEQGKGDKNRIGQRSPCKHPAEYLDCERKDKWMGASSLQAIS